MFEWPARSGFACAVVSPVLCATMAWPVVVAFSTANESEIDCVEKLKDRTTFAGLTLNAPAICRCAPVSLQMPLREVSVMLAQVGSAALMLA